MINVPLFSQCRDRTRNVLCTVLSDVDRDDDVVGAECLPAHCYRETTDHIRRCSAARYVY